MKLKIKLQVSIILTIILAITVGLFLYMAFQSVKEGSRTETVSYTHLTLPTSDLV